METVSQRKETMRNILRRIQAHESLDDLSFEEKRILKECYDAEYFEGLVIQEMISGRITTEYRHEPRLTLAGLQFLEPEPEPEPEPVPEPVPKSEKASKLLSAASDFCSILEKLGPAGIKIAGWLFKNLK